MDEIERLNRILLSGEAAEKFTEAYGEEAFGRFIDELLPEVRRCYLQEQNTPWHIYNVMGHILHSVDAMARLSTGLTPEERRMLAYVMFFHDLGKPECYAATGKFRGHNVASERIARRALPRLGFDERAVRAMCKLILNHDVFLRFALEPTKPYQIRLCRENVRAYIVELGGEKLVRYLIMVGRADNYAQNPQLTKAPLELIAQFEALV